MLQLQAISKNFGGLQVLQDVSFTMPEGSIFGLTAGSALSPHQIVIKGGTF
jgi:ABC-type branched-subunit amino acid transport system ATPase component